MSEISERLRLAREKSKKRKELLDCTLGSSWAEELGSESSFKSIRLNDETSKASILEPQNHGLDSLSATKTPLDPPSITSPSTATNTAIVGNEECPNRTEEFRDSTAFLKGTQSLNPHNDYSQNFVDTGQRPQNFISMCSIWILELVELLITFSCQCYFLLFHMAYAGPVEAGVQGVQLHTQYLSLF